MRYQAAARRISPFYLLQVIIQMCRKLETGKIVLIGGEFLRSLPYAGCLARRVWPNQVHRLSPRVRLGITDDDDDDDDDPAP
jgi:hypothetical protein